MKKSISLLLAVILVVFLAACDNQKAKEEEKKDENQGSTTEQQKDEGKNDTEKKDESKEEGKDDKKDEVQKDVKDAKEGIMVGDVAMDFELKSFKDESKTFKLSDYRGKNPVIIKFFASWCGPCHMEFPALSEIYKDNSEKGLVVMAVNLGVNDVEADVMQMIDDYLIQFPVLKDPEAKVAYDYNIRSIPVNIFIDKDGIIKEKTVGMQSKEQYEKNLKLIMPEE